MVVLLRGSVALAGRIKALICPTGESSSTNLSANHLIGRAKEEESNMIKFAPYLYFNGNCREAMTFYKKCLGGELKFVTVGESPTGSQMPASAKDKIMHSTLEKGNILIMASDWLAPTGAPIKGNMIRLCIASSTGKQEIEGYFSKLSKDGRVSYPLKEEFFGTFGGFTDKFGIEWMFQADKPKA